MKRNLLIFFGVLLPCAGLFALGFYLLPEPELVSVPSSRSSVSVPQPKPVEISDDNPSVNTEDEEGIQPEEPMEVFESAVDPEPNDSAFQEKVLPLVMGLEPKAQQCYSDLRPVRDELATVSVSFDVNASGRFEHVSILSSSIDEPRLTSCILNVIEQMRGEPTGLDMKYYNHVFTLVPSPPAE